MFKKTLVAGFIVSALSGCTVLGGADAAKLDRKAWSLDLQKSCAEMPKGFTPAGYAVDKTSQAVLSITKRQCNVLEDYQTLSVNYADLAGFMEINAGLSDEEMKAAIAEFDAGKPTSKQIGPRLAAYENASASIFKENLILAGDITLQAAEIAIIASENAAVIAQHTAMVNGLGFLDSLMSSDEEGAEEEKEELPIVEAYFEMQDRADLSLEAQSLINEEKALIERISEIDSIIDDKVAA